MNVKIGDPGYVIPARSEVVVANAIVFTQGGRVVAKVSATYDTRDLPAGLHDLFFQVVNKSCHTIVLPCAHYEDLSLKEAPPAKPPWYKRLFGRRP